MKVFYIKINDNDETGIDAISLVDFPAVQKNFLCFSEDKKKVQLKFDDSRHIITGVICLADTPIYRYSPSIGEYYIVFSKESIQKMVEKFAKNNLFSSVNLQHDDNRFVDGVYMIESYFVDSERGIKPNDIENLPEGSWVASYKVENLELWNEIINGYELNGFSLQGVFDLEESYFNAKDETFDEWLENYLN